MIGRVKGVPLGVAGRRVLHVRTRGGDCVSVWVCEPPCGPLPWHAVHGQICDSDAAPWQSAFPSEASARAVAAAIVDELGGGETLLP